jgi:serine/threonine protein kinase
MPLSAGTRLGPYEILAPIGIGGMGEVYRARDTKLDRDVAIKVLPPDFAQDPERLARFEREEPSLERLSRNQFHHQRAILDAINLRDVGVVERGEHLGIELRAPDRRRSRSGA